MVNRRFSERLNKELDAIGMPQHLSERTSALAKLAKLPKFKAQTLLNGSTTPDEFILKLLAEELEVNEDWLIGDSDSKTD